MRTVRVLRCRVCGTLWREPLPPGRAIIGRLPESGLSAANDAAMPAPAEDSVVQLIPLRDRRKTTDRRRTGYGGRRRDDVKRPTALSRKPRGEDAEKKRRN